MKGGMVGQREDDECRVRSHCSVSCQRGAVHAMSEHRGEDGRVLACESEVVVTVELQIRVQRRSEMVTPGVEAMQAVIDAPREASGWDWDWPSGCPCTGRSAKGLRV